MSKRFFKVVVVLTVVLAMSWSAKAQNPSGTCGTNLTWEMNLTNSTLTILGSGAMTDYTGSSPSRAPWYSYSNKIKTVVISDSATNIGDYAFDDCVSFISVTIPNSVTSIGEAAFRDCSALTSIIIPNGITSIRGGAFLGCHSLTSITIPNSVTTIEGGTFYGCYSLTSITIPNSITSIGNTAFFCCGLTSITIPDSVTSIGNGAFRDCIKLTSVTIGNSVKTIEKTAFANCRSLKSIVSKAITPPTLGGFVFGDVSYDIPVYVPCESVSAYKDSAEWYYFSNYIGYIDTTFVFDTINQGETYNKNGFFASQAGVYYKTLPNVDGCDSVICLTLTVTGVGIVETDNYPSLRIYPNPVKNGELRMENGELKENTTIEIYDMVGQKVYQINKSANQQINNISIDISHLSNGMYFLRVNNQVVKFIKE